MNKVIYFDDSQIAELANVRLIRYAPMEFVTITIKEFAQSKEKAA